MVRDNRLWLLFVGLAIALTVACSGTTQSGGGGEQDGSESVADSMTQG
jgi:hypothetical protein